MRLEFNVDGKPPRKDGANSMWGKANESSKIIMLRQSALTAMKRAGMLECFQSFVHVNLDLYVPVWQVESVGDLDNFISGICDGLQAIHPNGEAHVRFSDPQYEGIDPHKTLLIANDSKVTSIYAAKHVQKDSSPVWYRVIVEEVDMVVDGNGL